MIPKLASSAANFATHTRFYDSAREAMGRYLTHVMRRQTTAVQVVLPGFIGFSDREGSGVFDPVRASGLEPRFYALKPDLSVDLASLQTVLRDVDRGSVVVLIHYFGRTDPSTDDVAQLCREAGVHLLEDLAHAFFSHHLGAPAGRAGDAAIYSLHKMLPIRSGGMLQVRRESWLEPSTRPELAEVVLSYDAAEIASARRAHYEQVHAGVSELAEAGFDCTPLWSEIGPLDAPQTMPILIAEGRDDFYATMNARGFGVVSLYHTLITELPSEHALERRLAHQITNLPIHQDMTTRDVVDLLAAMQQTVRKGGV